MEEVLQLLSILGPNDIETYVKCYLEAMDSTDIGVIGKEAPILFTEFSNVIKLACIDTALYGLSLIHISEPTRPY